MIDFLYHGIASVYLDATLKIQNQSLSDADHDTNDNIPIYGKIYHDFGNGTQQASSVDMTEAQFVCTTYMHGLMLRDGLNGHHLVISVKNKDTNQDLGLASMDPIG